jgi:hypothetical protein
MTEFTVEAPALRRALTTALAFAHNDKKVDLPSINAVHIHPAADGTVEVAATDRFVLSVETLKITGEPFAFTVPYAAAQDLVRLIPRPRRNAVDALAAVTFTEDGVTVVARYAGASESTMRIRPVEADDHTFIKYGYLFNGIETVEVEPVGEVTFSPQILGRVFKALADRGDEYTPVKIQFRGEKSKPVLVTQGGEFKALVMKMPPAAATED